MTGTENEALVFRLEPRRILSSPDGISVALCHAMRLMPALAYTLLQIHVLAGCELAVEEPADLEPTHGGRATPPDYTFRPTSDIGVGAALLNEDNEETAGSLSENTIGPFRDAVVAASKKLTLNRLVNGLGVQVINGHPDVAVAKLLRVDVVAAYEEDYLDRESSARIALNCRIRVLVGIGQAADGSEVEYRAEGLSEYNTPLRPSVPVIVQHTGDFRVKDPGLVTDICARHLSENAAAMQFQLDSAASVALAQALEEYTVPRRRPRPPSRPVSGGAAWSVSPDVEIVWDLPKGLVIDDDAQLAAALSRLPDSLPLDWEVANALGSQQSFARLTVTRIRFVYDLVPTRTPRLDLVLTATADGPAVQSPAIEGIPVRTSYDWHESKPSVQVGDLKERLDDAAYLKLFEAPVNRLLGDTLAAGIER